MLGTESTNSPLLVRLLAIAIAIAHLYFNVFSTLAEITVSVLHFAAFGALLLLDNSRDRKHQNRILPQLTMQGVINIVMALLLVASCAYMLLTNDALYLERGTSLNGTDRVVGTVAVVLALELARRSSGLVIPLLSLLGIGYIIGLGSLVPGVFAFPGLSFDTVLFRAFFSDSGLFGSISRISWSFVFSFLLLGAFLLKSGCGDFIIKLSLALASKVTGGAGFVAVFSSALMGSISGSSVANTASTGVVTIPLMKRTGFNSYYAAGIESAASTGGQLMPPVMGAGAFIMASYTQIPYTTIVLYSIIPALLYYFSVFCYVRIEALRQGAIILQSEGVEPIAKVLREGWHYAIPFVVLTSLLLNGFTPTYAAGISIISVVAASWASKQPMKLKQITDSLELGSRGMATLAILLVCIGIPVMVINTTGIGNTFSLMLANWSGGNLLLALMFVALASLIIGMGLPVTASYIVIASLSAPTIFQLIVDSHLLALLTSSGVPADTLAVLSLFSSEQLTPNTPLAAETARSLLAGVPREMRDLLQKQLFEPQFLLLALLTAHLIIFWLSQDSNVTPPVCLVAFTAAAIAETKPMRTGLYAWKLAKGLYLIPVLMAYDKLILGSFAGALTSSLFALFGIYMLVAAIEGYMEHRLVLPQRLVCVVLAALLLYPHHLWWLNVTGLALSLTFFLYSVRLKKQAR